MKPSTKVSRAVAAILSAHAVHAAYAAEPATEAPSASAGALQEVIVTANRREENLQHVPISIQALTGETLSQLNVTTFDDYVRHLTNVTFAGTGPGQNQVYMRGLATTQDGIESSGATSGFPNVAIYLDDQSTQLPGRNLDVYAADLERIEVLEGPQGTLFGAGAQAGVIRYITNKPKLDKFEATANLGYATTAHGDSSNSIDGVINLPLLADKFAVRAVVYNESRGGYINNIPGTFTRSGNDVGIAYLFCNDGKHPYYSTCVHNARVVKPGVVPPNSTVINNDRLVGHAINPVVYKGIRISGLYKFDDDWNLLVSQSYQDMRSDGVFAQTVTTSGGQSLPELSTQQYSADYNKDRFTNTAWTVNGRLGMLKVVYAGAYLVRNAEQVGDYTNYARGQYADYYQCKLATASYYAGHVGVPGYPGQCYSPSSIWRNIVRNTHQSHELRLSTPDDARIRAIGGVYWEDYKIGDQSDWYYKQLESGFSPLQPAAGITLNNPNQRPATDAFYDDITRGYTQHAAFASVDFELIPKTLTLTGGTRWYKIDTFEKGGVQSSYHARPNGLYPGACDASKGRVGSSTPPDTATPYTCTLDLDTYPIKGVDQAFADGTTGLHKSYKGFKSRGNLTWNITPDALVYGTWSQGFRPGGFNRGANTVSGTSALAGLFRAPIGYSPDTLVNKELGWKTQWLNHRLQFNGAIYQEDWSNAQIGIFAPGITSNLVFNANGPQYRVRGLETEFVARATDGLTVSGSASWNHSELTNSPTLLDTTGKPIDLVALNTANPFGNKGDPLAQSPPFQANLRVRYEFEINSYGAFWQLAGTHHGHSYASTNRLSRDLQGNTFAYNQEGWSTLDGSVGVSKDQWTLQLYGENLTDKRVDLFTSSAQYARESTVNRPRTLGLRFGYKL